MSGLRQQPLKTDAFRALFFFRGQPTGSAGAEGYGLLRIGPRTGSGLCRPRELLRPRTLS
jgi:hypothetical protein